MTCYTESLHLNKNDLPLRVKACEKSDNIIDEFILINVGAYTYKLKERAVMI